jgi:hypothetical protein
VRGVQDRQQRVKRGQNQRAEDCARVADDAAADRRPADRHRGDRREQEGRRDPEVCRVVEADEQNFGHGAEHPAERAAIGARLRHLLDRVRPGLEAVEQLLVPAR